MKQFFVTCAEELELACSESFVPLRVNSATKLVKGNLRHVQVTPEVGMARGTCNTSEIVRTQQIIAEEPREYVLLSLFTSGAGEIRQSDRSAAVSQGIGAVYDTTRPYTLSFPQQMTQLVLQVPHSALGLRKNVVEEIVARPLTARTNRPLRVLRSVLEEVTAGTDNDAYDGESLADAAVTLMRSAILAELSNHRRPNLNRDAHRELMLHFLGANFADPQLTPADIASAHNVSLRYLQSTFAEVGWSPASYLRRYRLTRARDLLCSGSTVSFAAAQCGFVDLGTFNRAYRRAYGYSPSAEYGLTETP